VLSDPLDNLDAILAGHLEVKETQAHRLNQVPLLSNYVFGALVVDKRTHRVESLLTINAKGAIVF